MKRSNSGMGGVSLSWIGIESSGTSGRIYDRLLEWKRRDAPRYALMIDGARRVGKSYIAEEFAKAEYEVYVLIDFSKVKKDVKVENGITYLPLYMTPCL